MTENVATIQALTGAVEIADGRVTMSDRSPDARLSVRAPRHDPLSEHEPALELVIGGEGMQATVELSPAGLDALADAVYHLQEGDDGE